jgi:hypothetical protein
MVGCSEAPTHPTLATLANLLFLLKITAMVGCSEAPTHPTLATLIVNINKSEIVSWDLVTLKPK